MLISLSFARDAHAAALQLALADMGIPSMTLFVDRLWTKESLQSSFGNGFPSPTLLPEANKLLSEPYVLWLRRPYFFLHALPNTQKGQFARQEWRPMVDWLIMELSERAICTINPMHSLGASRNKLAQLSGAASEGFDIPDTLVSNSRAEILRYLSSHSSICKSFSPYSDGVGVDQRVFYTRRLSSDDAGRLDPVLSVPLIVQECLHKKYEIRAIFIDDVHFAIRILPDYERGGSVDWREHPLEKLGAQRVDLGDELVDRCRKLMKRFGIVTASFDFIVDENDRPWFLEFNEQGNFMFVDLVHENNVALQGFADLVARNLGCNATTCSTGRPADILERVAALFRAERGSDAFIRRL